MTGRRNWLLLTSLIAGGLFFACAESAQAQSYAQSGGGVTIRKDALEKVQWYKAPRQIQIINNDPIVSDHRTGEENPGSITIGGGPVGNGAAIGGGSTLPAGGLRLGNGPQSFRMQNSGLPQVGFGSNINEGKLKPGSLPSGKSTTLLAGKQVKQPIATGSQRGKLLNQTRPAVASKDQPIFTYPTMNPVTGSGKDKFSTSTSVSGVIKRRALLK